MRDPMDWDWATKERQKLIAQVKWLEAELEAKGSGTAAAYAVIIPLALAVGISLGIWASQPEPPAASIACNQRVVCIPT